MLERDGRILLVQSHYPNQPTPLWNLPGGRQQPGELLEAALVREFLEETGLAVTVGALHYLSESYDLATGAHFLNATFDVQADGEARAPASDPHAIGVSWVRRADLAVHLAVAVVREPLLAHLAGDSRRYFAFRDAGITIEFADPF